MIGCGHVELSLCLVVPGVSPLRNYPTSFVTSVCRAEADESAELLVGIGSSSGPARAVTPVPPVVLLFTLAESKCRPARITGSGLNILSMSNCHLVTFCVTVAIVDTVQIA